MLANVIEPHTVDDTASNYNDADCEPVSVSNELPRRYVTANQASALCPRVDKRLSDSTEWYQASLGTPDGANNCTLARVLARTGEMSNCHSGIGAFDMISNVWELTNGVIVDTAIDSIIIPDSGYVSGVTLQTWLISMKMSTLPVEYAEDYFWSEPTHGTYTVMLGGFYRSGSDGGII